MKNGIELITEERQRQIEAEGFGSEHDSQYDGSELAWAACYYAMPCLIFKGCSCGSMYAVTPDRIFAETGWDSAWAKRQGFSGDRVRDLVKAGALIAAEIDRLMAEPAEASDD